MISVSIVNKPQNRIYYQLEDLLENQINSRNLNEDKDDLFNFISSKQYYEECQCQYINLGRGKGHTTTINNLAKKYHNSLVIRQFPVNKGIVLENEIILKMIGRCVIKDAHMQECIVNDVHMQVSSENVFKKEYGIIFIDNYSYYSHFTIQKNENCHNFPPDNIRGIGIDTKIVDTNSIESIVKGLFWKNQYQKFFFLG